MSQLPELLVVVYHEEPGYVSVSVEFTHAEPLYFKTCPLLAVVIVTSDRLVKSETVLGVNPKASVTSPLDKVTAPVRVLNEVPYI